VDGNLTRLLTKAKKFDIEYRAYAAGFENLESFLEALAELVDEFKLFGDKDESGFYKSLYKCSAENE